MAVASVDIQVDARSAVEQLKRVNQQSKQLEAAANGASAAVTRQGRELQTAANGMRYFTDATGRARAENGRFLSTAERAAAGIKNQERAAQSASNAIVGLAKAYAVFQAVKFVFVQTAEIESQTRSLQVLTGSVEQAKQIVKELQALGAATPFTSAELIDAAKRLQAFGVEANKVVDTTRRLADVSGATGAELQGLVTAFGQVQAKGRLQGEELLQFQERGVALQKELQRMYKMSGEEFRQALEKGRFSAEAVEQAVINLTNAGGKYANGAIAQSDTLQGRLSTLQDSFQRLAQNIGGFFAPVFKFLINRTDELINRLNRGFAGASEEIKQRASGQRLERVGVGRTYKDAQGNVYSTITGRLVQAAKAPQIDKAGATPPALLGETGGGRKGKSDAEKAADKAAADRARAAEAIAESGRALGIAQQQFVIEQRMITARKNENELLVITRKAQLDLLAIRAKGNEILANKDLPAQAKVNEIQRLRYEAKRISLQLSYDISEEEERQLEKGEARIAQITQLAEGYGRNILLTRQLTEEQQKQKDIADGIANTIGQGMASAFDSLIQGTESFGASLRKIASGVLTDIANQLLRVLVINQAINAISSFLGPKTGGSFLPNVKFQPSAFSMPSLLPQRAQGGSVMAGQPYLVGERGPELFMPGRSGGIARAGSFGSGTNIVVNVDAGGTSVQGNQPDANALGRVIGAAVQAELIKQKRPGGLLT